MRIVIMAGGVGTRFWPLSRSHSPKQFKPIVGGKSTLALMYSHVEKKFSNENLFISTNKNYIPLIKEQLLQLSDNNIFNEPAIRDLGPAIGYPVAVLNKLNPLEPITILWSDDIFKKPNKFTRVLSIAEKHLQTNPNQIVYIGQKPLFPDQNKGWIHFGSPINHFDGITMHRFLDWHYRPPLEITKKYFKDGKHAVNIGPFVSTPQFLMKLYQEYAPEMYEQLIKLGGSWGTDSHQQQLEEIYPQLDKISFDDLISANVRTSEAVVLLADMGWFGFGDWEAVKAAQQESPEDNVTLGQVVSQNSQNSIIYNYTDKLVTGIDLKDIIVVATDDVIMVCPTKSVPEIKKLLKTFQGTENEKYT